MMGIYPPFIDKEIGPMWLKITYLNLILAFLGFF